jgi:hypothetical protein
VFLAGFGPVSLLVIWSLVKMRNPFCLPGLQGVSETGHISAPVVVAISPTRAL